MRAAEVTGGLAATLRARGLEGRFAPLLRRGDEVVISRSGGQVLMITATDAWAIEGVDAQDRAEIENVVTSRQGLVCYVAQATPEVVTVETRRFAQDLLLPEPIELGLDERTLEQLRNGYGVDGTIADVAAWL